MKTLIGKVVSIKMINTVVVEVKRQRVHPVYKKIIKRVKRYKVHNTDPDIKVGDAVTIVGTRPVSKEKHYKIVSKIT